jgi:hypothetical protein
MGVLPSKETPWTVDHLFDAEETRPRRPAGPEKAQEKSRRPGRKAAKGI